MKLIAIPSALATRRGAASQEQEMGLLDFSFTDWGRRKVHSNFKAGCGFGAAKERLNAGQTVAESHLSATSGRPASWRGYDANSDFFRCGRGETRAPAAPLVIVAA